MENTLAEVIVQGERDVMEAIAKQLSDAYKNHKSDERQYFIRQTNLINEETQMVEAYIQAQSAVNLRDITFLCGRHFKENVGLTFDTQEGDMIQFSNLHLLLSLAPLIKNEYVWNSTIITPFNNISGTLRSYAYKKRYKTSVNSIKGKNGEEILKIRMEPENNVNKDVMLCGVLYVDAKTLDILTFDGHLEKFCLLMTSGIMTKTYPAQVSTHITYKHDSGFPQIHHISTTLNSNGMECKTLVYCTDGIKLDIEKKQRKTDNMIEAINQAGYDAELWNNPIVMRTAEEEGLVSNTDGKGVLANISERLQVEKDSLSSWALCVDSFALRYPQEKVFLHLDNTCYFLGDVIRFKAYTRQTDTGRPSTISNVLYVDLLNHDGYLMERKIIRMQNGEGHGSFTLRTDSTMYSGYYELRAYTRWQLNWGVFEHPHMKTDDYWFYNEKMAKDYFRDYEKLYSRVVPVYDKPLEPGDYTRDMTLRRMMRYYPFENEAPKMKITFFPEGGNLVEGVENRVAFEAVTEEGEYLKGSLSAEGQTVKTTHRGRGVISVTPRDGKRIKATFVCEDGRTLEAELPKAEEMGVAVAVHTTEDSTRIHIQTANLQAGRLGLTVMHEGKPAVYQTINTGEKNTITLKNTDLAEGVNQLTVYGADGRVWADRLFFVRGEETGKPTLDITGLKDEYTPYENITLKVKGDALQSAGNGFSVSVRDAYNADEIYDNGSVLTEMLLSSEIRGFVPNPGWYFDRNDAERRMALDLLMMTQGWRRFVWKDMASGTFQPTEPAEKNMQLSGEVRKYRTYRRENREEMDMDALFAKEAGAPEIDFTNSYGMNTGNAYRGAGYKAAPDGTLVHLEFIKGKQAVSCDVEVQDGVFHSPVPNFTEACLMHINASDTTKWEKGEKKWWQFWKKGKHQWILPDESEWPEFYVRLYRPHPRHPHPYSFYHTNLPQVGKEMNHDGLADKDVHQMKQVTVRSKHGRLIKRVFVGPAIKVDAYEAFNAVVDAGLLDGYMPGRTNFSKAVAHNYIGDMGVKTGYGVNMLPQMLGGERNDDGINTSNIERNGRFNASVEEQYNWLYNLDSVMIYTDYSPRFEGDKKFEKPNLPEVTVFLKRMPNKDERGTFRDRFMKQPGYSIAESFYSPDYSKYKLPEGKKDYRRTLYWNPNVQLDENGEATITLYNNSRTTNVSVEVNGQAKDGTLLTGKSE